MFGEVEFADLLVSEFNARWIITGIEIRFDGQPGACGRIRDQIHNHAIAA